MVGSGMVLSVPAMLLLGIGSSPHCALVCGPAGLLGGRSSMALAALHAGRLGSYALLGALSGGFGARLLMILEGDGIALALRYGAAASLPVIAFWRYAETRTRTRCCTAPRLAVLRLPTMLRGMLWGLLPCGLLYSVLLLSGLSGGAFRGALLALAFGLGTTPLLLCLSTVTYKLERHLVVARVDYFRFLILVGSVAWLAAITALPGPTGTWCSD
jgi:sulfite exporter TauE/SafE